MLTNLSNAILRGGPEHRLNEVGRIRYVADLDSPVKIPVGGGYEHFHPTADWDEQDGRELRVFSWTHRTFVAE